MPDEKTLSDYPLSTADVAKMLGYHPQYVRELASKGKIPGIKVLKLWRFNEIEISKHFGIGIEESSDNESGIDDIVS